jgi:rhodanese-related sulfurtransferase
MAAGPAGHPDALIAGDIARWSPPGTIREVRVFSFLKRLGGPQIDVAELDALLAQGAIHVLDVREESEFRGGHLPGAIHVPVKRLPDRVGRLKRDKPYAVICASGSRSRGATNYLLDQGFEGTVSVRGGTGAWARSGRPLVR